MGRSQIGIFFAATIGYLLLEKAMIVLVRIVFQVFLMFSHLFIVVLYFRIFR